MFKYSVQNLSKVGSTDLSKRSYLFVKNGEIDRNRPETEVKTVNGTREIHQLVNSEIKYILKTRKLSCFCKACVNDNGICSNITRVGEFKTANLKLKVPIVDSEEIAGPLLDDSNYELWT